MELQAALENRYSCRAFTDEAPTDEAITAVLEAGRLAPTACNKQQVHVWVAKSADFAEQLDACTKCRFGAPVVFILAYDEKEEVVHTSSIPEHTWSYGDADVASVLVHMALKATDLGYATCWLGAFNEEAVHAQFGIPEHYRVRALLDFGTAADVPAGKPSLLHQARKPLAETVTWL